MTRLQAERRLHGGVVVVLLEVQLRQHARQRGVPADLVDQPLLDLRHVETRRWACLRALLTTRELPMQLTAAARGALQACF